MIAPGPSDPRRTWTAVERRLAATLMMLLTGLMLATGTRANLAESAHGDFSNDPLAPSMWILAYGPAGNNGVAGSNVLSGAFGRSASGVVDRDYITFTVPTGFRLSELRLGQQISVGGNGSFIGLALGPTMPVAPDATSAVGLLGWHVYSLTERGSDLLDNMQASGNGASGFARPLEAGLYTLWLQELAVGPFDYRFNFILSPVPEPGQILLMAIGLLALAAMVRRQRGLPSQRLGPATARSP